MNFTPRFPKVQPEIDTIRLYFDLWKHVDLYRFFDYECKKGVMMYQREIDYQGKPMSNPDGTPVFTPVWEKKRADSAPSWFQKMQVTVEHAKEGDTPRPVLAVEYSVAKWYNVTNGVNSGNRPSMLHVMQPIWSVLCDMHIDNYTPYNKRDLIKAIITNVQIRRLDLSYNFKTNFPVPRVLLELSTCRLNNKAGEPLEKNSVPGTVAWGGGRGSNYKAMFYDKEREQNEYFHKFNDNTPETQRNKQKFWQEHRDLFKNVLRFEVQYRSKYFLYHFKDHYKDKKDMEMFNKIIDLCEWNWADLLRKFDEQLGMSNVRPEEEYTKYQEIMSRVDKLEIAGGISRTQADNMKGFIERCYKRGWHEVWAEMGKSNFGVKYRRVKKLCGFDLKMECLERLPIMRIMQQEGETWNFALKWSCSSYPSQTLKAV